MAGLDSGLEDRSRMQSDMIEVKGGMGASRDGEAGQKPKSQRLRISDSISGVENQRKSRCSFE